MNKIEEIKRYDETEAVSQSFLKKLMKIKWFNNFYIYQSP